MAGGLGHLASVGIYCKAALRVGGIWDRGTSHISSSKDERVEARTFLGVGAPAGTTTLIALSAGIKVSNLQTDSAPFPALGTIVSLNPQFANQPTICHPAFRKKDEDAELYPHP